jgi:SAM-dependent methyltransferase
VSQPIERFSNRVENYSKYRPGYPAEVLNLLKTECNLTADSIIADIGSGTGKLTEILLANGNVVFGIEPNAAMRAAAESALRSYPAFRSIVGTAERTTMPAASVDLVAAGQAFHWFDTAAAKTEFPRILRPGGWVVLVWNDRQLATTPFLKDYEKFLLEFGTDYQEVRHDKAVAAIEEFFAPEKVKLASFSNSQVFDLEGLKGRVLSSSYTPDPNHSNFESMLRKLENIFKRHQENGHVTFQYDTKVYYGHLPRP